MGKDRPQLGIGAGPSGADTGDGVYTYLESTCIVCVRESVFVLCCFACLLCAGALCVCVLLWLLLLCVMFGVCGVRLCSVVFGCYLYAVCDLLYVVVCDSFELHFCQ